jgi:hypothetical protein
VVEVEDAAFADINVESDVLLASAMSESVLYPNMSLKGRSDALQHMLLCTTDLRCTTSSSWIRSVFQTADTLAAEDLATEEAEHGVRYVLARCGAASLHRLFHQGVVVLRQANELEYNWVTEA